MYWSCVNNEKVGICSQLSLTAHGMLVVRYYEDYEIDEVKGLSNLTQMYIEVRYSSLVYCRISYYVILCNKTTC